MNGIDAKRRLSVPASLREVIETRSGAKSVVLAPSEYANCLVGYDINHFDRLRERLEAQYAGDFGPGRSNKARALFALTEEFQYDETGRVGLTQSILEKGGLTKHAVFLGAGDYFEVWDPELLFAEPDQSPMLLRSVRALMGDKGA